MQMFQQNKHALTSPHKVALYSYEFFKLPSVINEAGTPQKSIFASKNVINLIFPPNNRAKMSLVHRLTLKRGTEGRLVFFVGLYLRLKNYFHS